MDESLAIELDKLAATVISKQSIDLCSRTVSLELIASPQTRTRVVFEGVSSVSYHFFPILGETSEFEWDYPELSAICYCQDDENDFYKQLEAQESFRKELRFPCFLLKLRSDFLIVEARSIAIHEDTLNYDSLKVSRAASRMEM